MLVARQLSSMRTNETDNVSSRFMIEPRQSGNHHLFCTNSIFAQYHDKPMALRMKATDSNHFSSCPYQFFLLARYLYIRIDCDCREPLA